MDNCTSHPSLDLSNVKLQLLPPKATSQLQPLDAGIICNFKMFYRLVVRQKCVLVCVCVSVYVVVCFLRACFKADISAFITFV